MALEYRILFAAPAPVLSDFLLQLPVIAATHSSLVQEEQGWSIIDEKHELIFSISASKKADYLDFSFGPYHYQSSWYIRFNTSNRFLAKDVFLGLLKHLLITEVSKFIAIFNGELVILHKENDHVYLNSLSGILEDSEALANISSVEYTLAEYPVV
jgi:hypothetical protein